MWIGFVPHAAWFCLFLFIGWTMITDAQLTSWSLETSQHTPSSASGYIMGYDPTTNNIWMLGGNLGGGSFLTTATKWDLSDDSFSLINLDPSYTNFHAPGQIYTQMSRMIYFLYNGYVGVFNMETELIDWPWNDVPIPAFETDIFSCLANNDRYLFAVGGYWETNGDNMYYLDTMTPGNGWSQGPSMNYKRENAACNVVNDYLYIFGGQYGTSGAATNTIERLNIGNMNGGWITMATTMSRASYLHRTVVFGGSIYILGGYPATNNVEMYDPQTDVMLTQIPFSKNRYRIGGVIANGRIYVIGGTGDGGLPLNDWETSNILPTVYPTAAPTSFTSDPSKTPTNHPSKNPTQILTNNPSFTPTYVTQIPTYLTQTPTYDTGFPTNNPSTNPTYVSQTPTYITQAPTYVSQTPTVFPTNTPLFAPTYIPSNNPTASPVSSITANPSLHPTDVPSLNPSQVPSDNPSFMINPAFIPSNNPTNDPSNSPSFHPTNHPFVPISTAILIETVDDGANTCEQPVCYVFIVLLFA
eukprot:892694_1